MVRLSLIERLETILNIIKNSNEAKFIIPSVIIIAIILIIIGSIKKKLFRYISAFFYIVSIALLIYFYHEPLLKIVDYFIENIVNNILFPNLAVYGFILLVINGLMINSIVSNKVSKGTRYINILCFSLMQLSLIFIIKLIIDNNIDIYEKLNIYTNQNLLVLIEFSMQVFVIWMILLLINKIVNKIVNNMERKRVNYTFTTLVNKHNKVLVSDNLVNEVINPTQIVLNYELDDNMELIEYVPIKKKKELINR